MYRTDLQPWWYQVPWGQDYEHDGSLFRSAMPAADWDPPTDDGDPRLTPSGDIARIGTVPDYVTFAVYHPGHINQVPQ